VRLAANVPYYSLPDLFRDRQVVHWIVNTSAISCLIHGYSNKPDSALLVNAFNLYNAGLRCRIQYEYVESKADVADLPRRVVCSCTSLMCSVLVSFLPSALVRRPGPGHFARLLPQGALRRCNIAPGSAQVCRGTFVGAAGVPPRLDLEVCKACDAHLAIAATQDFPPPSLSVTSPGFARVALCLRDAH